MIQNNLTEGPIFRKLIRFSLPMIAGNLLQQVYNITDTLIVGRFIGSDALAAVGSAYTLMIFVTSILIGLCMGSGAVLSKDFGADDLVLFQKDVRHSFVFISAVMMLLYCILYPGLNSILHLLQIPDELFHISRIYIAVVFTGILFIFLFNFLAYVLRSMGNSVVPLIFLSISSILNIVLDFFFVVFLQRGVFGAALATVLSQAVAGIGLSIYSILRYPILRPARICGPLEKDRMRSIVYFDLTTGIQQSVMNFGILMIQGLVNSFGTVVMAAFAAAVKIDTLAYMPAQEFGNAYSLFISQNFGAHKKDRIQKGTRDAFLFSVIFCLAVSSFIFVKAPLFMSFFLKETDHSILMTGVQYLRIEGSFYVGIGILFLWYGYFRAIEKPQISLYLTIVSLGMRVLLSYTLAPSTVLGVTAIWMAIPIGWALADFCGLLFFKKFHPSCSERVEKENVLGEKTK